MSDTGNQPLDDPPATQGDVILAVAIIAVATMFCSLSESRRSNNRYNNLREQLERIEQKVQ